MVDEARTAGGMEPVLEMRNVSQRFGPVEALHEVSAQVRAGEVACVVGSNGAGKSVFTQLLCGVLQPSEGEVLLDGEVAHLHSARDARKRGIIMVYQDLALVPLMSAWRNFFLGAEPTVGRGPLRRIDVDMAREQAVEALAHFGVDIIDPDRPVQTLSGGQRQVLAIARAVSQGARVLILDEPTSALGVRQSSIVLRVVQQAASEGAAVLFVTPKSGHAYLVGHRFLVFQRGRLVGDYQRSEITREQLTAAMSGFDEASRLERELAAAESAEAE